nr:cytochrome c peroxidase [Methylorubrum thiocyanatum]
MILAAAPFGLPSASPSAWRWSLPDRLAVPVVPADNPMSAVKVALGRRLFYDADLSIDGTMACATCHEQKRGFADGTRTRPGVHGDQGLRNVPGLANVAWLPSLTWGDPRITSLEAQAYVPLFGTQPVEMGMAGQEPELVRRLHGDACYRQLFRAAFPERGGAIDIGTVTKALASFQRSLVSYDAPVDRGETSPAGAALFRNDCAGCHSGSNFTDGRFHRITSRLRMDRGLADITGRTEDAGLFRTPSLRNVAVTAPYLHDGRAATLREAIAAHGYVYEPAQSDALLAYLHALTDLGFLSRSELSYPDSPCAFLDGDDR